jgi:hypothetical protein
MHASRRYLTYSNVAATLALIFAMSGGALAANHYLINSTKQISPKVLKKLAGTTGKAGPAGKEGTQGKEGTPGKEGPQGREGPAGPYPVTLPSGQSESGTYAVAAGASASGFMAQGFAFPIPLAGALDGTHAAWLASGTTSANCPGVGHAAAGFLCAYESFGEKDGPSGGHVVGTHAGVAGSDATGFMLFFSVTGSGAYSYGSWTVTAA